MHYSLACTGLPRPKGRLQILWGEQNTSGYPKKSDSGALVTLKDTDKRHLVGVLFAGSGTSRYIIPAKDIKSAFSYVVKPFSHYWGTKEDYRAPSTN